VAIVETPDELESAPANPPLPPGWIPHESVNDALRRYRAGEIHATSLVDVIDASGDELERVIGGQAVLLLVEVAQTIDRLHALRARLAVARDQWHWLKRFPGGEDVPATEPPLSLADLLQLVRSDSQLMAIGAPACAEKLRRLIGAEDAAAAMALVGLADGPADLTDES
jgi:hypothetical protein